MPAKFTLVPLFVSFLALFNIGLALPTDSLSLKRVSDAEPDFTGAFDLAKRADKPADPHNHTGLVECFSKIYECDFNHKARNHTVCADKFLSCLPALSPLKPRMNSTAKPKAGPVTLDGASISAGYVACSLACLDTRTRCRRLTYDSRSRCDSAYIACMGACSHLLKERNFEDPDLQARATELTNIEARATDPEDEQEEKRFYPYPSVINPKKPITGHPLEGNVPNPPFVTREASPVVVKPKIVSGHPPEGKVPNPLTKVPREANADANRDAEEASYSVAPKLVSGHHREGRVPYPLIKVLRGWPSYAEFTKCVEGCKTTRASCKTKAEQTCGTKYSACTKACGRLEVRDADAAPAEEFYPWPPHTEWADVSGEFSSVEGRDLEVIAIK